MAEGTTISVLVADSSLMTAQLIAASLKRNRNPHIHVLLPAAFTSEGATRDIMQARPDVALVSASLSDGPFAGYSVLRSLQQNAVATRVILLLEDGERELIVDAFRTGARGVFLRSEPSTLLSRCVHCVHQGQIWAGARQIEYLVSAVASAKPLRVVDAKGHNLLSKREDDVVALVADGLTNREISEKLKLSEHTIKSYLFNIFEKLGISTRVELVLYALSEHRNEPATLSKKGSDANPRT